MKYIPAQFSLLFTLALLVSLCGCSTAEIEYEVIKPKVEYQYLSRKDALIEEVLSTPTTFSMPSRDAAAAWRRGRLFFEEILNEPSPTIQAKNKRIIVSNNRSTDKSSPYLYTISRSEHAGGEVRFHISCQPRSHLNQRASRLNAHNLARFIHQGTLARELLTLQ